MRICKLGYMGPGLKNERQLEDLDTAAAHFAKLKGQVCRSCKQRGHIARNCLEKSKSVTCESCGESGHDEENCDVKKYQRSKTEKSDKYRKAYAALGVCDDGFCVLGY